jgi:short-subunit dehydrogenase
MRDRDRTEEIMSMSIVINTPTSHIGSKLAARLLDAGEKVTVTSRDKKKVEDLAKRGARVVEGFHWRTQTVHGRTRK